VLDSIAEFCYSIDKFHKYEIYYNHTKYEIKQYVVNYVNTALIMHTHTHTHTHTYIYIYILIYINIYITLQMATNFQREPRGEVLLFLQRGR
jgi:hypothetical protein